jgi:hypothetical protein
MAGKEENDGSSWGALDGHQKVFFHICALYIKHRKWIAAPATAFAASLSTTVVFHPGASSPALTVLMGLAGAYSILMIAAELIIAFSLPTPAARHWRG